MLWDNFLLIIPIFITLCSKECNTNKLKPGPINCPIPIKLTIDKIELVRPIEVDSLIYNNIINCH